METTRQAFLFTHYFCCLVLCCVCICARACFPYHFLCPPSLSSILCPLSSVLCTPFHAPFSVRCPLPSVLCRASLLCPMCLHCAPVPSPLCPLCPLYGGLSTVPRVPALCACTTAQLEGPDRVPRQGRDVPGECTVCTHPSDTPLLYAPLWQTHRLNHTCHLSVQSFRII